jgi:hypothetical protein
MPPGRNAPVVGSGFEFSWGGVMLVRAFICCTALVLGLLVMLGATAQSAGACNGAACRPAAKSHPLDLMSFMNGRAKADNKAGRPSAAKTATHSSRSRQTGRPTARPDNLPDSAPEAMPAAAAAAYAAEPRDVQVVTGDQLNVIDMAMLRTPAETVGAAPRVETVEAALTKLADVGAPRENASSTALPTVEAEAPRDDTPSDDSWMGRFWAAIGDRFVVLVTMLRQLFA